MTAWEVVIGLETHVQLATRSKIFSGASTAFGAPPNTQAGPVDLALPGVLPVFNAAALDCAVKFGRLPACPTEYRNLRSEIWLRLNQGSSDRRHAADARP
jgi:Asp-tRNA(Asn)/Glu-tRNA(Gln) amidotransferase B subunit